MPPSPADILVFSLPSSPRTSLILSIWLSSLDIPSHNSSSDTGYVSHISHSENRWKLIQFLVLSFKQFFLIPLSLHLSNPFIPLYLHFCYRRQRCTLWTGWPWIYHLVFKQLLFGKSSNCCWVTSTEPGNFFFKWLILMPYHKISKV